jgi:hypothetical protein
VLAGGGSIQGTYLCSAKLGSLVDAQDSQCVISTICEGDVLCRALQWIVNPRDSIFRLEAKNPAGNGGVFHCVPSMNDSLEVRVNLIGSPTLPWHDSSRRPDSQLHLLGSVLRKPIHG